MLLADVKGECDAALGADFVFSVRSKELIIGEVYIRIYNEQPMFPLEVRQVFTYLFYVLSCCRKVWAQLNGDVLVFSVHLFIPSSVSSAY